MSLLVLPGVRSRKPLAESSDAELVRAIGAGDRAAFDVFYARMAPRLAVRLRRRCRDDDLVAEVLQDTFVAVWRSAGAFAGSGEAAGWVWSTASRKLVDAYRRREVHQRDASRVVDRADLAVARSAEEEALVEAWSADVAAALHRLSPELQQVLRATVLDGLTTRETAVLLGVPEGTVKTRAVRARRQLREALA